MAGKRVELGCQLGEYRVLQQLGSGGAGTVFLAEVRGTGEKVALKTLRPGSENIEEIHARFIREITVAQKVKNEYVVEYRDCDVDDGVLYYAMQYFPLGSLADVLSMRGVIPWRDACECGVQIALGLGHFHDSGILHRDVKPANIFLSEDGRLKLGDFGLARDLASHSLTLTGTTVGTGRYLAPEQARGNRDLDGRADLYQLGCNLFEFMVGHTPFVSPDNHAPIDLIEMMRRHIEDAPPNLADLAPQCPQDLIDIVNSLLAKHPEDRPESAVEVASRLQQILDDHPTEGGIRSGDESSLALTERLLGTGQRKEVSMGRLLVVGGILLFLISVAAITAAQ